MLLLPPSTTRERLGAGHVAVSKVTTKGKVKAIPLEAWTGPEGSSRLKFPDFKTFGT